jgi:asparagine N-glycosylation enzyme membrane subunit Stt3
MIMTDRKEVGSLPSALKPRTQVTLRIVGLIFAVMFMLVGLWGTQYSPGLGWLCFGGSAVSFIVWFLVTVFVPIKPEDGYPD